MTKPYAFQNFAKVVEQLEYQLQFRSHIVHTDYWQGVKISDKPDMATREVTHISFSVDFQDMMKNERGQMRGNYEGVLQYDLKPNLPWADDHFNERVCGYPINPGKEWKKWPWGNSAEKFLDERGKFNHNYMERYWPKHAGFCANPTNTSEEFESLGAEHYPANRGILYEYGDLNEVVSLLADDPLTRQAYLPVWFPEDTGGGSKRAPCTIGYHFIMRDGKLDINYHIRSCDFLRHFRDDVYLTSLLLLWILEKCKKINPEIWQDIKPGKFVMQIGSLHIFVNDYYTMFKKA